jgi:hypothetical protein
MLEPFGTAIVLGCICLGPFLAGMLFEKLAHRTGRNPRTATTHENQRN